MNILFISLISVISAHQAFAIPFTSTGLNNITSPSSSFPDGSYKVVDHVDSQTSNLTGPNPIMPDYDRPIVGTWVHLIIHPRTGTYIPKQDVANTLVALQAQLERYNEKDPITETISFPPAVGRASFEYVPRPRANKKLTCGQMMETSSILWHLYLQLERSIYWVGMLLPVHVEVRHVWRGAMGEIWIKDSLRPPGGSGPAASASAAVPALVTSAPDADISTQ